MNRIQRIDDEIVRDSFRDAEVTLERLPDAFAFYYAEEPLDTYTFIMSFDGTIESVFLFMLSVDDIGDEVIVSEIYGAFSEDGNALTLYYNGYSESGMIDIGSIGVLKKV